MLLIDSVHELLSSEYESAFFKNCSLGTLAEPDSRAFVIEGDLLMRKIFNMPADHIYRQMIADHSRSKRNLERTAKCKTDVDAGALP